MNMDEPAFYILEELYLSNIASNNLSFFQNY
jgi:hypothetical protein